MLKQHKKWKELIETALEKKAEYNFLDFKSKLSDNNARMKEHINAFGNLEQGSGCFVFGVDAYTPVGVSGEWDTIIKKMTNLAKNAQEPSLQINTFPIEINGKKLLCVEIMSSPSRPVFIKDRTPLGGNACFKRTGASTVSMSIQEIKDLLVYATSNHADEAIVEAASIDQLDFNLLKELLPNKLTPEAPSSPKNIAVLLDQRILVKRQDETNPTAAGWLCFAKQPHSIKSFRNAYIELQIFQGITRDNPIKKYEIKGNLPYQIEQAVHLLQQHIWLTPKIHGIKREEVPAYSEKSLREVVTNSIVHRDYRRMHQPVKISMFTNRIEIENPGCLMPGLTPYNLIHKRDWRNPLLAELMKNFGFGEMDGQGIDRLYAGILTIKVPPPIFLNHENSFCVVLSAPKAFEEFTHKEKRLMVIILLLMHEYVDNKSVRSCFDITREKAGTLIKAMVAENVIQPSSNSRKYARYIFTELYKEKIFS